MSDNTISVLRVRPHKLPDRVTFPNTLEALQLAVGGHIQAIYPFDDPVAIVCDEEAKLTGKELNRALFDEDGCIYDIIAGDFLVVGLTEDDFGSLTEELMDKYYQIFEIPQNFVMFNGTIHVI